MIWQNSVKIGGYIMNRKIRETKIWRWQWILSRLVTICHLYTQTTLIQSVNKDIPVYPDLIYCPATGFGMYYVEHTGFILHHIGLHQR